MTPTHPTSRPTPRPASDPTPLSRRAIGRGAVALGLAPLIAGGSASAGAAAGPAPVTAGPPRLDREVAALEAAYDTTIGLVAYDTAGGRGIAHRPHRRLPMLSVFKTYATAAVLQRHGDRLGRRIWFPPADLLEYAPIAEQHVDTGMTLDEICDASVRWSDNTAANLQLREIGGPRGLTAYLRSIGDDVTRLDRWEPDLNEAAPGDPRDTTTPHAAAQTLQRLLLGRVLAAPERRRLRTWMLTNETAATRLQAGFPRQWRFGSKTGSGDYGTSNDAGVVWRRDASPLVVVAFTRRDRPDAEADAALLPAVGELVARRFSGRA